MPKLRTETIGTGDMSWLDSTHGIANARTVTIDISTFTAGTHFPNGYIPAGTPVGEGRRPARRPVHLAEGTTTGLGVLAGHLLTDVDRQRHRRLRRAVHQPRPRQRRQGPHASFAAPVAAAKRANVTIDYV
jgi:hypothetical protein